jgi:hypothetical protein
LADQHSACAVKQFRFVAKTQPQHCADVMRLRALDHNLLAAFLSRIIEKTAHECLNAASRKR